MYVTGIELTGWSFNVCGYLVAAINNHLRVYNISYHDDIVNSVKCNFSSHKSSLIKNKTSEAADFSEKNK